MTRLAQDIDYGRRTLLLLCGLLAFRLAYAAIFATNPAGDEAYYWDWGRRLDYGYYSKPPFIAWLYAFVDRIGGGSLFSIRATAALIGTGGFYLLYRLASELFDTMTGWLAVLLGATAPANSVLSFFLTIDAPLLFCWTAALWMFVRIERGKGTGADHLLLFAALATGHLCKQMMMVFPVLALLHLALSEGIPATLRRTRLCAVLLGSYVSILPPILWNARHDWITFRHTSHHFEATSEGGNILLERLGDFFSFLGTQFGVLSPGTAFVLFSLALTGLFHFRRSPSTVRLLLVFSGLPIALMLLLALRQELQPNWAAAFYVPGIVLAAAWYAGKMESAFPPPGWRKLLPGTLACGIALSSYFYLAPPLFLAFGKEGHVADPNRRLLGFDRLATEFEKVRRVQEGAEDLVLITVGHRDLASQLAFGLPDRPRLYRWEPSGTVQSQYEVWNDPVEDGLSGADALILVMGEWPIPGSFAKAFERIEPVAEFRIDFRHDLEWPFTVYRGRNLKSWPDGLPETDPAGTNPP